MPDSMTLIQMVKNWGLWMADCLAQPMATPVCRPLWEWVMYGSATIGILLILWVAWKVIDYRFKYAAAVRAQMERERVAPPEVIEQHKFKEAGDLAEDVTDPHLAEKIRAELDRRRLENARHGRPK